MDPPEELEAAQESTEDESTVPTGPWEEDENEDCPAYHTAAFRMYVMKVCCGFSQGEMCFNMSHRKNTHQRGPRPALPESLRTALSDCRTLMSATKMLLLRLGCAVSDRFVQAYSVFCHR